MSQVLVVENDRVASLDLKTCLQGLGYGVSLATTGEGAMAATVKLKPDVILMGVQLDGTLDGIEAAARIQAETDTPLIFLTAYTDSETMERAARLEPSGYIIKPFNERDLATTLQFTLLKRRNQLSAVRHGSASPIQLGNLQIDPIHHRVTRRGVELQLTKKEFLILQCLAERPDVPVSAEEMLTRMWGPQFIHYIQTLRVHIGNVRKKIEHDSPSGILIETVRGVGYRIVNRSLPCSSRGSTDDDGWEVPQSLPA